MPQLKIQKTVQDSMDAGYVTDPMEAAKAVAEKAGRVFGEKLRQQKVKDVDGDQWFVGMSLTYDTVFVGFRGRYFDTHLNIELLDVGLEGFYFVVVDDPEKTKEYDEIKKRNGNSSDPLALEYAFKKEWLN